MKNKDIKDIVKCTLCAKPSRNSTSNLTKHSHRCNINVKSAKRKHDADQTKTNIKPKTTLLSILCVLLYITQTAYKSISCKQTHTTLSCKSFPSPWSSLQIMLLDAWMRNRLLTAKKNKYKEILYCIALQNQHKNIAAIWTGKSRSTSWPSSCYTWMIHMNIKFTRKYINIKCI